MLEWKMEVVETLGSKVYFWYADPFEIQLVPQSEDAPYCLSITGDDDTYVDLAYVETLEIAQDLAQFIQSKIDEETAGEDTKPAL